MSRKLEPWFNCFAEGLMAEIFMHKPIHCTAALTPSFHYQVRPIFQCPCINAAVTPLNFKAKLQQDLGHLILIILFLVTLV